jgi:hypothetical protein
MQVRTKTGRLGIRILINVPEWSDMSSHSLVFFIDTNNFISEGGRGGMGFAMPHVCRKIFLIYLMLEKKWILY